MSINIGGGELKELKPRPQLSLQDSRLLISRLPTKILLTLAKLITKLHTQGFLLLRTCITLHLGLSLDWKKDTQETSVVDLVVID